MADFSAVAGGGLNVGTLTINLALNTSDLSKKLDEVNRNTKSMADKLKSEFDKMGGSLGNFGERIGQASKAIEKMFGDKAPAALQQFGKEAQRALGLSDSAVKGLAQSASAMEGAFKAAGIAVNTLLSPLGAVLAAALGVAAAVGAVKNAMDALNGSGSGGGGGKGLWERMDTWAEENVPGARWTNEALGTAGRYWRGRWNEAAAVPGSVAETVSKANPFEDLKSGFMRSFNDLAKGLESVLGPVMKMLQPGTSKADASAAAKSRAKAEADRLEEQRKAWAEADEAISIQLAALADQDLKDAREAAEQERELRRQQMDSLRETMRQFEENERAVQEAARAAEQQRVSRWQALGSGQLGTAAGWTGAAGASMNIVGGAMAGYQLTGTVMQGAAQGGQAGGPWGAVIGAIVALATQTESFRKLMSAIEDALGNILPLLSELLEPIVASITGALDVLNPVLKLITKLADALGQVLKPVYAFADAIGDLLDAIGGAIDAIDLGGLTGALDKSVGDKNDQWGKYSVNDWLTGVGPLISELGAEIDKATKRPMGEGYDGPSAAAQNMMAQQEQARRDAWDNDPRNPYYALNMQAKSLADIEAAQIEAKQSETREAERAADALRELADSVMNNVQGYKLQAVMYGSQDRVGGEPAAGNPGGY